MEPSGFAWGTRGHGDAIVVAAMDPLVKTSNERIEPVKELDGTCTDLSGISASGAELVGISRERGVIEHRLLIMIMRVWDSVWI